jgi:hypothetical protein
MSTVEYSVDHGNVLLWSANFTMPGTLGVNLSSNESSSQWLEKCLKYIVVSLKLKRFQDMDQKPPREQTNFEKMKNNTKDP